jgi:hypothetical protein
MKSTIVFGSLVVVVVEHEAKGKCSKKTKKTNRSRVPSRRGHKPLPSLIQYSQSSDKGNSFVCN